MRLVLDAKVKDFTWIGFTILVLSTRRSGMASDEKVVLKDVSDKKTSALTSLLRL